MNESKRIYSEVYLTSMIDHRTDGQVAFEAYSEDANNMTFDGKDIPNWNLIGIDIRSHWEAGAREVLARARLREFATGGEGR